MPLGDGGGGGVLSVLIVEAPVVSQRVLLEASIVVGARLGGREGGREGGRGEGGSRKGQHCNQQGDYGMQ